MSDPFLPVPPEDDEARDRRDLDDLEDDRQPDVDAEAAGDDPGADRAAVHAAQPDRFRSPRPGDRLSGADLEADLG